MPYGSPADCTRQGAFHVESGTDYYGNELPSGGWLGLYYHDTATDLPLRLVVTYDDATGLLYPDGTPPGYSERCSLHVRAAYATDGCPLTDGGWLAFFYQNADAAPAVLLVIAHDDLTGINYPYGTPAGYREHGSVWVDASTDYQGHGLPRGGRLAFFYREGSSPGTPPVPIPAAADAWTLYP